MISGSVFSIVARRFSPNMWRPLSVQQGSFARNPCLARTGASLLLCVLALAATVLICSDWLAVFHGMAAQCAALPSVLQWATAQRQTSRVCGFHSDHGFEADRVLLRVSAKNEGPPNTNFPSSATSALDNGHACQCGWAHRMRERRRTCRLPQSAMSWYRGVGVSFRHERLASSSGGQERSHP